MRVVVVFCHEALHVGAFPRLRYSTAGKFVNFFMILIAAGLVGIPLGVIQQGFQEKLLEDRERREAEEASRIYSRLFAHYDKDNSGSIGMDELADLMQRWVCSRGIPDSNRAHLVEHCSTQRF